jgi:valine--pyruvate aminotransferase
MTFSLFGDKFTRHSGITRLMEDLNDGLRTPGAIMLGGGNPAQIPEMNDYFQTLLAQMLESGKATDALCNYDGPQGKTELLALLAEMLRDELGWDIEPQNIALTNGSQSAFFYLFNLFAGRRADGTTKKVLFPLAPDISATPIPAWKRICSSPRARTSSCCRKASSNITSILNTCILAKRRA